MSNKVFDTLREQVFFYYGCIGMHSYLFAANPVTDAEVTLVSRVVYDSNYHRAEGMVFTQTALNIIRDMLLMLKKIEIKDERGFPRILEYQQEVNEILFKKKPLKF